MIVTLELTAALDRRLRQVTDEETTSKAIEAALQRVADEAPVMAKSLAQACPNLVERLETYGSW